jgi:hypothetical protein
MELHMLSQLRMDVTPMTNYARNWLLKEVSVLHSFNQGWHSLRLAYEDSLTHGGNALIDKLLH